VTLVDEKNYPSIGSGLWWAAQPRQGTVEAAVRRVTATMTPRHLMS
jgi:hypothetical protein